MVMPGGRGTGIGMVPVIADPVTMAVSAGVQLAMMGIQDWVHSSQVHGSQRIATTEIVNRLEPKLRAVKDAYLAGPRTMADQQAALAAVAQGLDWLQSPEGCGNQAYEHAGLFCISERMRGGKWDWYSYYYDPIANDTPVDKNAPHASGTTGGEIINAILGGTGNAVGGVPSYVWLIGGVALAFVLLPSGKSRGAV